MKLFKCDNCGEFYVPYSDSKPEMSSLRGEKFDLTIIAYHHEKVCTNADLCIACLKKLVSDFEPKP